MASTYTAYSGGGAAQLLEPPAHPAHTGHTPHPAHHGPEAVRHRMPRQSRGSGQLLGVTAVTAALGATGLAAAPAYAAGPVAASAPAVTLGDETSEALSADPGLALFARIQQQADGQAAGGPQSTAEETARFAAAQQAEARRAVPQMVAQQVAPVLPVAGYTLFADHGRTGSPWAQRQIGLDFAARTGTPVTAIAAGTVTAAGWSGAYGYRVIQTLPDGTELWYCHLDRIATAPGRVAPGTPVGTVGATGHATVPHLHLEVRPTPGVTADPLAWLRSQGLNP